ncbi:MAG TPA: arylamine N-acetyltransferase [Pirellulales bacterium]|nr:arylamine N-acetyltransferase [Pirellulales bacterium]
MDEFSAGELDLDRYFERIGYAGPREPTLATLTELHLAHATGIPFENLDIQLGRPISIDLRSIQAKLLTSRRGGYCFEQNTLLAAALERLGFRVRRLAGRVRLGASRLLPRTHMLLGVEIAGEHWLADVGFGTGGLLVPLRMSPGEISSQFSRNYRLREEERNLVLESLRDGAWHDLYVFSLDPYYPIDYEMANHYVSTHPESRFVQTLAVQKQSPTACYLLRNRELTVIEGEKTTVTAIDDDERLLTVLAETFGLVFPAGTRFRCLQPGSELA